MIQRRKIYSGKIKRSIPFGKSVRIQSLDEWENPVLAYCRLKIPSWWRFLNLTEQYHLLVFGGRRVVKGDGEPLGKNKSIRKVRIFRSKHDFFQRKSITFGKESSKLINLRKLENKDKKVGVVIFNFPPNAVNIGTAAHLDVFSSLYNTLLHLKKLDIPLIFQKIFKSLRKIVRGKFKEYSSDANVVHRTSVDDYVSQSRWLSEVEDIWGVAPGKIDTDGESIYVQGLTLGNVFIGVQPVFWI